MSMNKKELAGVYGENLKKILDKKKMSIKDLERLTGISYSSLFHYVSGHWPPMAAQMVLIAEKLNVPLQDFVGKGEKDDKTA